VSSPAVPGDRSAGRAAAPPLALLTGPDQHGVAVITLNRPEKKNALSIALRDEVTALLDGLSAEESVKALIITGSGGNFSAGFDLAILCDLRIATHRAEFAHPETAFGPVVYGPLHDLLGGKEKFITRSAIAPGTPTLDL
jgi:enoyl-CoA hydratase/carnithine racemase